MRSLLLIVFVLTPTLIQAQSVAEPRTWSATPFVGLTFAPSRPTDNGLDLGSTIGLGASVSYDLTSNLGFEGEIARGFDVASSVPDYDESVTTFSANALYHFDVLHVTPYATFGLGFLRSGVDAGPEFGEVGSFTELAYNFGGGVKYKLGDSLLARADLRRFQANDAAPDHWRLYGGLTFVLRR